MKLYKFLALTICTASLSLGHARESQVNHPQFGEVFELTEINFDSFVNVTSPPWMIMIYASWCPACRDLEPSWRQVAVDLAEDGILVGRISGPTERALLRRFSLRHFPSIFHITGAETREFVGRNQLSSIEAWARGGWRNTPARTGCESATSRCGRFFGQIATLPTIFKAKYFELRDEKHYSDVSLFSAMLAVPVVIGLCIIGVLDFYYSRSAVVTIDRRHGQNNNNNGHLHRD